MIKYSDASNVEKVAQKTHSSSMPMKECCYEAAIKQGSGVHKCGCGNEIVVSEERS
jgi:hypothetical protein